MSSHRADLRLSNPDWNEYELLGGIRRLLRDTKNRSDHKPLLSTDMDARKTLRWINKEAGTKVQGHGLRSTSTSITEELVSSALLKRMMDTRLRGT
jgi:hypothetical protein